MAVAHTRIEIVERVVEAALAEEVRQRGSAALADADPSSGLNDLASLATSLNNKTQSSLTVEEEKEQRLRASQSIADEVRVMRVEM